MIRRLAGFPWLCLLLALAACAARPPVMPSGQMPLDPTLPAAVAIGGLRLQVAALVPGGRFYSGYGARDVAGGSRQHRGIDISAPNGTPVHAAAAGQVEALGRRGDFGRLVLLRHAPGLQTLYAHLSGYAPDLAVGRVVRAGELIGYVGSSGNATGPHLHFELRRDGRAVDPLAQPNAAARDG